MMLSEIYTTLGNFMVWAIDDPATTVMKAFQKRNPDVSKPFIIYNILGFNTESLPMCGEIDDQGIQSVGLNQTFTVSIEAFADELHKSEELLNAIKDRVSTTYARYTFFKYKFCYRQTLLGVNSIPVAVDAQNESRAILEMEFGVTKYIDDDVGLIEHINMEVNNEEIIIN